MTEKPEEEKLPVSEKVKVLRFQTPFKGGRLIDCIAKAKDRERIATLISGPSAGDRALEHTR